MGLLCLVILFGLPEKADRWKPETGGSICLQPSAENQWKTPWLSLTNFAYISYFPSNHSSLSMRVSLVVQLRVQSGPVDWNGSLSQSPHKPTGLHWVGEFWDGACAGAGAWWWPHGLSCWDPVWHMAPFYWVWNTTYLFYSVRNCFKHRECSLGICVIWCAEVLKECLPWVLLCIWILYLAEVIVWYG